MTVILMIGYFVLFLFIVAILVSVLIILINVFSHYKESRYQTESWALKNAILQYLEGQSGINSLKKMIPKNEEMLVGVLAQISVTLDDLGRFRLVEMLERLKLEGIQGRQLTLLQSKKDVERQKAATLLPFILRKEQAVEPLIKALQDKSLDVRLAAARALGELRAVESIAPLIDHLALAGDWPTQRLIEVVGMMGPGSVDPLISLLQSKGHSEQALIVAIASLGRTGDPKSLPTILAHLSADSLEIKIHCVKALGLIGDRQAVQPLILTAQSPEWELRSASVSALGMMKDQSAIPVLMKALSDSTWWVRFNAANALYGIGQPGIEALTTSLQSEDRFARDISKLALDEKGRSL